MASQAVNELQKGLHAVSSWCTKWLMEINIKKTTTMYFGKQNLRAVYTLDNQPLNQATQTRDLGIIVSETGNVSEHVKAVALRARRLTGIMLRTFRSRKQSVILPVLKSIIRPVLEYASPVWCPGLQKDIKEIESVQRKITKCIHGLKTKHYAERLQILNLPTLEKRRTYFDLLECYKIINGLVRSECKEQLVFSENSTRGYHTMLHSSVRPPRLNIRKHFFTERVLTLWNSLPKEVTQSSTYNQFKVALRKHLNI
jgi:ribonuclease P/MRP protein subunit RPP40